MQALRNLRCARLNWTWLSVGVAPNGLSTDLLSGYALSAAMVYWVCRANFALALELRQTLASWVDPTHVTLISET